MGIVTVDFETTYDKKTYSLSKIATEAYIRDPQFQIIGVSVKLDGGPTQWITGTPTFVSVRLKELCDWSQTLALSHNAHFDMAIMLWHLGIRPKGFLDTLSMANALHGLDMSCSLKALAEHYGLPPKGTEVDDASGKRLEDFTVEELEAYGVYCCHDTDLCYELFNLMAPAFTRSELRLIDITVRMFVEPMLELDQDMLEKYLMQVRHDQEASLFKLKDMLVKDKDSTETERMVAAMSTTEEVKTLLRSNQKFATLLRKLHVEPPMKISPTTGKPTYAFAKTDEEFSSLLEHEDPMVQAAVAARLGNKTTIEETRTQTFIGVAKRGAFPFPIKYSGAYVTHRWSGFDYNVQNMSRGGTLRKSIRAPRGYKILAADQSNIELRLGLYMACQDDKVKLIEDGVDLYVDIAVDIFGKPYGEIVDLGKKSRERTTGKVVQLSSIYGTGHVKLKDTLRIQGRVRFTEDETQVMTNLYRSEYDMVVSAWGDGQEVLDFMYHKNAGAMNFLRPGILQVTAEGITKPSGLVLRYPDLRWSRGKKDGRMGYSYAQRRGMRDRTYGSKVFQRSIQSLARDIIAEQILEIDKHYRVVGTVHDEVICLIPNGEEEAAEGCILEIMRVPPVWAPGLPLDAEVGIGDNYGSAK